MATYYETTITTARTRLMHCEECDTEFVYELKLEVMGSSAWSMSWSEAAKKKGSDG